MSADNYFEIRYNPNGDGFIVVMGSASDENEAEASAYELAHVFETWDDAFNFADSEYSEYGVHDATSDNGWLDMNPPPDVSGSDWPDAGMTWQQVPAIDPDRWPDYDPQGYAALEAEVVRLMSALDLAEFKAEQWRLLMMESDERFVEEKYKNRELSQKVDNLTTYIVGVNVAAKHGDDDFVSMQRVGGIE